MNSGGPKEIKPGTHHSLDAILDLGNGIDIPAFSVTIMPGDPPAVVCRFMGMVKKPGVSADKGEGR